MIQILITLNQWFHNNILLMFILIFFDRLILTNRLILTPPKKQGQ